MAPLAKFSIGCECIEVDGRKVLKVEDSHVWREFVDTCPLGKKYVMAIEEEEGVRSLAANRYLWGIVYKAIEEYTGMPKDGIHDDMCDRFLRRQLIYIDRATGEQMEKWIRGGSSGLSPKAFADFVENVRLWAGEFLGISFDDRDRMYQDFRNERARLHREAAA